jgi:hypothetical protein
MPTLDISRAAQSAIERIEKRCGAHTCQIVGRPILAAAGF